MKIKLDENLPNEMGELLSSLGHDVHTVPQESLTGHVDRVIYDAAVSEGRLLFTQDLDFADIRKFELGAHPGIVLLRLRDPSRRRLTERLRQAIEAHPIERWSGCFVVIGDSKLRIRSL